MFPLWGESRLVGNERDRERGAQNLKGLRERGLFCWNILWIWVGVICGLKESGSLVPS